MSIIANSITIFAFAVVFSLGFSLINNTANKKLFIAFYSIFGIIFLFCFGKASSNIETNAVLPDNMYYLGVEVWDSKKLNNGAYEYTFGCVDSKGMIHDGVSYTWISNHPMRIDVPYILTMDNNDTKDASDDNIVSLWQLAD